MDLKNPFGLRNGRIILIEDLTEAEKGLNCNCICPACHAPFEARMGEIRRHHFAHSGDSCDELNAYMTGLYLLLQEYLLKNLLWLPPVVACFNLSGYHYITLENADEYVWISSQEIESEKQKCELVYSKTRLRFDSVELIKDKKGKIEGLLCEKANSKLAIRIIPPSTVCRVSYVTKYQDYATVEIDLSKVDEILQTKQKSDVFSYLQKNSSICSWIYNPEIRRKYPKICKRSKAYYDKAQENERRKEKEKQEELRRKKLIEQKEKVRQLDLRIKRLENDIKKVEFLKRAQEHTNKNMEKEEKHPVQINLEEMRKKFTQQDTPIKDDNGVRWVQCEKCKKIAVEDEFSYFGTEYINGKKQLNLGVCRECVKQKK